MHKKQKNENNINTNTLMCTNTHTQCTQTNTHYNNTEWKNINMMIAGLVRKVLLKKFR